MMRNGSGRTICCLLLAGFFAVGGCGERESSGEVSAVRDSAGIRIVENTPEMSTDSCVIPNEPAVSIGAREGPPEHQLYRVMGATRLSDGRIAIVNQGSSQIRLFDADGRFLHAFGREGDGPGEFRNLFLIWSGPGDTLIVGDYRPWEFLQFTPEGELLGQVTPRPQYPNVPEVVGVMGDGTFVLGRECCRTDEPGFHEVQLHLVRHNRSGEMLDTLGVYPRGRMGYLSRETNFLGRPLFEAMTRVAAADHRVVVGMGTERELRILTDDGELRTLVRWTGPDRNVTDADAATYREQTLARYEGDPEARRRFAEPLVSEDRPVAERFPAHSTVLLDEVGGIWVRKYPRPSWPEDDDMRWLVFREDGRLLCHARTPPGIENVWDVREIGSNGLLATVRDSLGVEYLHVYRLNRPETSDR